MCHCFQVWANVKKTCVSRWNRLKVTSRGREKPLTIHQQSVTNSRHTAACYRFVFLSWTADRQAERLDSPAGIGTVEAVILNDGGVIVLLLPTRRSPVLVVDQLANKFTWEVKCNNTWDFIRYKIYFRYCIYSSVLLRHKKRPDAYVFAYPFYGVYIFKGYSNLKVILISSVHPEGSWLSFCFHNKLSVDDKFTDIQINSIRISK